MRMNLPVSQVEYTFPAGETLVTTTDLQGRIIYCNQSFIDASGFVKEELLGQPHNIIRHPDMPAEAFRDMWATISSGLPWSGLVKNRRKSGEFYWVQANVTPLLDNGGKVTGYMSVRTCPTRIEVQQADQLYRCINQETQQGKTLTKLRQGKVQPKGWFENAKQLTRFGLFAKIAIATSGSALLGFFAGHYEAKGLPDVSVIELISILLVAIMCGAASALYLKQQISRPIEKLIRFANQIAGGNLTQKLELQQQDEIGQLANSLTQLNANLMSIVRDARHGVFDVRAGTQTISEGNLDLSTRTESAAANLEQTAASMEQITSNMEQNASKANTAAKSADQARSVADQSAQAVDGLSETMRHINEASHRISEIIQVVDGIAFQTNILALNAAVEAARAGEHGRGFAVVANEVRTLSQRTSTAAREVRSLIQTSVEQVEEGSKQTGHVKDAMTAVNQSIEDVYALISDISHGMGEQMLGVQQVNQAVAQLDSLTQQNAALVEEISASAVNLNHKADDVAGAVGIFKLQGDKPAEKDEAVMLRKRFKQN